jgi:hypothetical protein
MNLSARIGVAIVLLAGAALFVVSLQMEVPEAKGDDDTPGESGGIQLQAGPEAKPGVLDSHETCQGCHEEIWNEWVEDRHSKAFVGALYTELSENRTNPTCWSCHAPRPILETGIDASAVERTHDRDAGITCLTCHVDAERKHVVASGEHARGDAAVPPDCGPVGWDKYPSGTRQEETIQFCGRCHNLHGTHLEFLGSKYAREGQTCLTCHMQEKVGEVANGGQPRKRRSHRMHGGHSPKMLRRAMRLDPRIENGRVFVRIVNKGAGHRIPTDARHRAIRLYAAFFSAEDVPIPVHVNGVPQREVELDVVRLFYRQEQKEPTQVEPAGTLGKNNWRESSTKIPEAARGGGYVRLQLYYMLRHDWPKHKATLVEEKKVPLE